MRRGFTFTELIIVTGMMVTLIGLGSQVMLSWRNKSDLEATRKTLLADIQNQQIRSMTGACSRTGDCGVYFGTDDYVLFDGSVYDQNDPANFRIPLEVNFQFSNISLSGNQMVFEKESGEIVGYDPGRSQVEMTETSSGRSVIYHWNKYGVEISP